MYYDRQSPEWPRVKITIHGKPVPKSNLMCVSESLDAGSYIEEFDTSPLTFSLNVKRRYGPYKVELLDNLTSINEYLANRGDLSLTPSDADGFNLFDI